MSQTAVGKKVRIVDPRADREFDVVVEENDTAADIIKKTGKKPEDVMLLRPDNTDFNPGDQPYAELRDGMKLEIVNKSRVGVAGLVAQSPFQALTNFLFGKRQLAVARPRQLSTLASDEGWRAVANKNEFRGQFRVRRYCWDAYATRDSQGRFWFFMKDAPKTYVDGSEWAGCFRYKGDGWSQVDVWDVSGRRIDDLNSGVAAINQILRTTFERAGRL